MTDTEIRDAIRVISERDNAVSEYSDRQILAALGKVAKRQKSGWLMADEAQARDDLLNEAEDRGLNDELRVMGF